MQIFKAKHNTQGNVTLYAIETSSYAFTKRCAAARAGVLLDGPGIDVILSGESQSSHFRTGTNKRVKQYKKTIVPCLVQISALASFLHYLVGEDYALGDGGFSRHDDSKE